MEIKKKILMKKPDVIINFIGYTNLDFCENNKDEAYKLNVELPKKFLEVSSEINSKFIQFSTDYVFDGKTGNYKENDEKNPTNYYGYTKHISEIETLQNLIASNSVTSNTPSLIATGNSGTFLGSSDGDNWFVWKSEGSGIDYSSSSFEANGKFFNSSQFYTIDFKNFLKNKKVTNVSRFSKYLILFFSILIFPELKTSVIGFPLTAC